MSNQNGIKMLLDTKYDLNFVQINTTQHDLWASNVDNNGQQILAFGLTDDDGMFLDVLRIDEHGNVVEQPNIRL